MRCLSVKHSLRYRRLSSLSVKHSITYPTPRVCGSVRGVDFYFEFLPAKSRSRFLFWISSRQLGRFSVRRWSPSFILAPTIHRFIDRRMPILVYWILRLLMSSGGWNNMELEPYIHFIYSWSYPLISSNRHHSPSNTKSWGKRSHSSIKRMPLFTT